MAKNKVIKAQKGKMRNNNQINTPFAVADIEGLHPTLGLTDSVIVSLVRDGLMVLFTPEDNSVSIEPPNDCWAEDRGDHTWSADDVYLNGMEKTFRAYHDNDGYWYVEVLPGGRKVPVDARDWDRYCSKCFLGLKVVDDICPECGGTAKQSKAGQLPWSNRKQRGGAK